jgi:hypothetical protein
MHFKCSVLTLLFLLKQKGFLVIAGKDYMMKNAEAAFGKGCRDEFLPERFMEPNGVARNEASFKNCLVPFGKGAHAW